MAFRGTDQRKLREQLIKNVLPQIRYGTAKRLSGFNEPEATFIVDRNGVIQWVDVNQGRVGRNVAEVLRVLVFGPKLWALHG